ncbi:MAG: GTP cyclohydrolase I FolE [Candidatus Marinimicrobia bacterium]|nr:GTP cyclohydrolase I FolE [Candidatus Neomarinimicrobiota bacterium]MDG1268469.1 GTP cyclohydrolase I FolE [Candidatus Neomarinimicrobiota bacterium]MDG2188598.1 GTP cyclohydrolase I FolE [Candidatus Neomarinimicrobiota bacterium]|tara:strand:+ start:3279 stop:3854 length:576 start_codon:yes stop_codon:yes gene_type:complete
MKDNKRKKLEANTRNLLELLGEDPKREGLMNTPKRVAKAWDFLTKGYTENLDDLINNAIFEGESKDMVIVKNIEFYSLCEHHMIPFYGKAHIGYIPDGKIIGLSKLARITDLFAQRLQVQERLTNQIAQCLQDVLNPRGVAVVLEGKHFCMLSRGVQKQNSIATSSSMLGIFREKESTRNEFLKLIQMNNI